MRPSRLACARRLFSFLFSFLFGRTYWASPLPPSSGWLGGEGTCSGPRSEAQHAAGARFSKELIEWDLGEVPKVGQHSPQGLAFFSSSFFALSRWRGPDHSLSSPGHQLTHSWCPGSRDLVQQPQAVCTAPRFVRSCGYTPATVHSIAGRGRIHSSVHVHRPSRAPHQHS